MPSSSSAQHKFFQAVLHNKDFAKKVNIPQSVAEDFINADKKQGKYMTTVRNRKASKQFSKHIAAAMHDKQIKKKLNAAFVRMLTADFYVRPPSNIQIKTQQPLLDPISVDTYGWLHFIQSANEVDLVSALEYAIYQAKDRARRSDYSGSQLFNRRAKLIANMLMDQNSINLVG